MYISNVAMSPNAHDLHFPNFEKWRLDKILK